MRYIMILLSLGMVMGSYAQKTITKEEIINKENVQKVANIYKGVKGYDYAPQYLLNIGKATNFSFELLVNDVPVFLNFRPGIMTGTIPINKAILKSGVQTLTVRMTPPVEKGFYMASEIDFSIVDLRLNIEYGDYTKEKASAFKEVLNYELSKKEGKLPYYEVNLTFNIPIVAYEKDIIGWENSVDLSKENKEDLLKEVEAFYREMMIYTVSVEMSMS